MQRLEADKYFEKTHHNLDDEQPYEFKRRTIKKLGLDVYVEDNWDILEVLRKERFAKPIKLLWLSNPLDWSRPYQYKFKNFRTVVQYLKKLTGTV